MENSPLNPGKSPAEKAKETEAQEPELKAPEHLDDDTPKVSREHDFTHTHPDHAKHKNFGMDHEPGAF